MTELAPVLTGTTMHISGAIPPLPDGVAELIERELAPRVFAIDQEGFYPGEFLQHLGAAGGFRGPYAAQEGGSERGLGEVIRVMEAVSQHCTATGFLVWCQHAGAWYLHQSDNADLKRSLMPALMHGTQLGGTGMSNTMKSRAAIEDIRLKAVRIDGGYRITGALPWVSNLGPGHTFAVGAGVEGEDGLLVFFAREGMPGLTLSPSARFVAMEGTGTFSCQFRNAVVPDAMVVAHPAQFGAFVRRMKAGFILTQMGMGLGLAAACIDMMKQANRSVGHVNRFLDEQPDDMAVELQALREATYALAAAIDHAPHDAGHLEQAIRLRIAASETALATSSAAMLHMGAKGYLMRSPAQRRVREAYFVAIVTPALKHLKKELHDLRQSENGIRAAA